MNRVILSTGKFEYYTPAPIVELARDVMGGIDLDPASCEVANRMLVRATKYFDIAQDGLSQRWGGRIWLNPPYKRGLIDKFIEKLVIEYTANPFGTEAIVLTNNSTETYWYHMLSEYASAICLLRKRIRFYEPGDDGSIHQLKDSPLQGQVVTYLGRNADKFCYVFREKGACFRK